MPPATKLDHCVILYDLNSKNQRQLRQALLKIYFHYYCQSSKNLVNLVLVNSYKTSNRLNSRHGKKYTNIKEVNPEAVRYDPNFIYDKIEERSSEGANWMEALILAIQIINESTKQKAITSQILYLTDLTCSSPSNENLLNIVSKLKESDIFLYIVGSEVSFPRSLTSFDRVQHTMENITLQEKNLNLLDAKKIALQGCKVVICDVKKGLQLFLNYKNVAGKQPWLVPLTIGTKISLAVNTSKSLEKLKGLDLVPKWKENHQFVYASIEDSTKIYELEDVHPGILKHNKFVAIQNNQMFKPKTERVLSVSFVMEIGDIPAYILRGPSNYIIIQDPKDSSKNFRCLLSRLQEKQCCLVAKRVYNKGNIPIYLALFPVLSKSWFRAVQLPYSHEINEQWTNQKLEKTETDVSTPTDEYLSNLIISSSSNTKEMMTHNLISTSGNNLFVNTVADKILKERLGLNQVDYNAFVGINSELSQTFKDKWPSRSPRHIEEDPLTNASDNEHEDAFF